MATYGGGNKQDGGKTIPHKIYLITHASNGVTKYTTFRYADDDTSCDCPGWTRHKPGPGGRRECKHTRRIAKMTASLDETGGSSAPASPAPPPANATFRRSIEFDDEE